MISPGSATSTDSFGVNLSPALGQSYNFAASASLFSRAHRALRGTVDRVSHIERRVPSKFVPTPMGPKGNLELPRNLEGLGEFVLDPLQNFRPEVLQLEGYKYSSRVPAPSEKFDQSQIRSRGRAVYQTYGYGKGH